MSSAQFVVLGVGGAICALNFYLSFGRYLQYHLTGRSSEYRFVSVLPAIGSFVVVASLICFQLPRWAQIAGIVLVVVDTGGIHWFLGTMAWKAGEHAFRSRRQG